MSVTQTDKGHDCRWQPEAFCFCTDRCANCYGAPSGPLRDAIYPELKTQPPDAARIEPLPNKNEQPAIQDLVQRDIDSRKEFGLRKYGTPLQPFNGRDALMDAYQEALDLVMYLRQAIYEKVGA